MNKTNLSKFKGVIPAMNSCYDSEGNVSAAAAKKLTRYLIDRGVGGLYVCGSTGEGLLQQPKERKAMLAAVIEEAAGQVPVIAHIGAMSTRESVELALHAKAEGADAISAVPPFYYHCSNEAAAEHWLEIVDRAQMPFIIYHIPSTTGFHLSVELLQTMLESEHVIGVKCSSLSTFELQQFKAAGGENFLVFNGPDEQYLAGRVMGADAGIGGTYSVMPELYVYLEKCIQEGNIAEAGKVQHAINDVVAKLLKLPIYDALKELLRRRGVECGNVRKPLQRLSSAQHEQVISIHQQIETAISQFQIYKR